MTLGQYPTKFKNEIQHCLKLLDTKDKSFRYCLVYKDWIDYCPPKCGYFEEGEAGTIENVKKRKLNFECLYFSRDSNKIDYFCILFNQESPFCEFCKLPLYKD
ncbi:MAG: hypothetical protein ACFFAU_00350 [Candidatus Hodarchaeota archaeon]